MGGAVAAMRAFVLPPHHVIPHVSDVIAHFRGPLTTPTAKQRSAKDDS
jgi:hypothetical protein